MRQKRFKKGDCVISSRMNVFKILEVFPNGYRNVSGRVYKVKNLTTNSGEYPVDSAYAHKTWRLLTSTEKVLYGK